MGVDGPLPYYNKKAMLRNIPLNTDLILTSSGSGYV